MSRRRNTKSNQAADYGIENEEGVQVRDVYASEVLDDRETRGRSKGSGYAL